MCFSAESSFAAAVILILSGIVLVKKFYNSSLIYLALMPIFFGLQQFAEAAEWIVLEKGNSSDTTIFTIEYIFLFFAYMFWPVWLPFAFGYAEKVLWRKLLIGGLMLSGLVFSSLVMDKFLVYGVEKAYIYQNSIYYGTTFLGIRVVYAIITQAPYFISSIPKMWILGIANVIAFIIADVSYNHAFTSIWCGACAIITIGLFLLLKPKLETN